MRDIQEVEAKPIKIYSEEERTMMGPRRSVHLWEFLLELLMDESCSAMIQWTDELNGEFKLKSSEDVARKWGERKHKDGMNYDKLSRALRYYYSKDIIKKVSGRRFVYKFVPSPEMHAAVNAIKNHMIRLGIKMIPTGPFPHFQMKNEENNNLDHKDEKFSPAYHNIRPRSHSPNLDYNHSRPRPSPPLSLSPPGYFSHQKRLPENHIVLGHHYENRDLVGKMNGCRSYHSPKHFEHYRARLSSERQLSTRDRDVLSNSLPLDNRRSRIASTGDVYSTPHDDRMREIKRFVYENSRQLRENGIHIPSRGSSHSIGNPSPMLSTGESPKPKDYYSNDSKSKSYPRDRFYSENFINLDSTVFSDDVFKEQTRQREEHEQHRCCSDCPTSRRNSESTERNFSPSYNDGHSRASSRYHSSRTPEIRPYENGFSMSNLSNHKYPFDYHRRSYSYGNNSLKPPMITNNMKFRNPSSHEIKYRPYELTSSTKENEVEKEETFENNTSPDVKQENDSLDVASNEESKSNDSDNDVFISNNSQPDSHPTVGSSPPPRVYCYHRYSPMYDVGTQTCADDFENSVITQKSPNHTEIKEKCSPIQTCVITSTDTHQVTFTSVNNGYKSDSLSSSRNSTPSSFSSSPPPSFQTNSHQLNYNPGFNESSDNVNNSSENTVVVYPNETA